MYVELKRQLIFRQVQNLAKTPASIKTHIAKTLHVGSETDSYNRGEFRTTKLQHD